VSYDGAVSEFMIHSCCFPMSECVKVDLFESRVVESCGGSVSHLVEGYS